MVEYSSAAIYITSRTSVEARIAAIEAVIDSLMTVALDAAGNSDLLEYYYDSGQSKVTMKYRNSTEIIQAIQDYEKLKEIYVSKLNGRMVRQIPEQNFRRPRRC